MLTTPFNTPRSARTGRQLSARTSLLPARTEITSFQVGVLVIAVFMKGGLLGAYVPFSSLWLSEKGYDMRELGMVQLVDASCSLLLPVIGGALDRLQSHNLGFTVLLVLLTILKLSYIPAASSFALILVLTAFTAPLLRASNSVLDSLTLFAFEDKGNFAKVRLFGDIGFGALALAVGIAYSLTNNIDVVFWLFAGICLALSVFWTVVAPFMVSIRPDAEPMEITKICAHWNHLATTVLNAKTARALFCVWLFGVSLGLINTFELVLLKSLKGNGMLLGICKLTGTLAGIPVWWFLPTMMKSVGVLNLQLIGLGFATIRLGILGVITNPWYALVSECCAGMGGVAVAYGMVTVFAGQIIEEDMKGTVQAIILVVFIGFGAGISSITAGYFAHTYGLQEMFWTAAALTAAATVTLALYDLVTYFWTNTYESLEESIMQSMQKTSGQGR